MLGLKRGTVYLSGHDPLWEAAAQQTIQVLKRVLGEAAADIKHVGSTSIRGIKAKPIIDLAVGVRDYEAVMAKREALGKEGIVFRLDERPGQLLFVMGDFAQDTRTHHIHVVLIDSQEWDNYLIFRNYLNGCAAAAREYEAVKEQLAAAYPCDREAYTAEKGQTVVKLLEEACRCIDSETGVFATPVDVSLGLSALGTFSDGTSRDITADAVWTSSDESVGRAENGVFAALRAGETTVTAGMKGSDVTASVKVAVSDAAVESLTVGSGTGLFETPVGVDLQLTLQANYSDGTSKDVTTLDAVTWSSNATAVLTAAKAEVKGVKAGKAKVTAEFEGVSVSQEIEVTDAVLQSIAIEGETSTPMAIDLTLRAMGTYSDGTTGN